MLNDIFSSKYNEIPSVGGRGGGAVIWHSARIKWLARIGASVVLNSLPNLSNPGHPHLSNGNNESLIVVSLEGVSVESKQSSHVINV